VRDRDREAEHRAETLAAAARHFLVAAEY
jgi:hypothetical protein